MAALPKAAPGGASQEPLATLACCSVPAGPGTHSARSQAQLSWTLSLRASQGHSTFPSKVNDAPAGLPPGTSVGSLPSAGFLQAHPGSEKAAPAISAPWLHLGLDPTATLNIPGYSSGGCTAKSLDAISLRVAAEMEI